jgi:hypothetical protein
VVFLQEDTEMGVGMNVQVVVDQGHKTIDLERHLLRIDSEHSLGVIDLEHHLEVTDLELGLDLVQTTGQIFLHKTGTMLLHQHQTNTVVHHLQHKKRTDLEPVVATMEMQTGMDKIDLVLAMLHHKADHAMELVGTEDLGVTVVHRKCAWYSFLVELCLTLILVKSQRHATNSSPVHNQPAKWA